MKEPQLVVRIGRDRGFMVIGELDILSIAHFRGVSGAERNHSGEGLVLKPIKAHDCAALCNMA